MNIDPTSDVYQARQRDQRLREVLQAEAERRYPGATVVSVQLNAERTGGYVELTLWFSKPEGWE